MYQSMVERMARAMAEANDEDPDEIDPVAQPTHKKLERWRGYATKAAYVLQSMREPTIYMIAVCGDLPVSIQEAWPRLIDAAQGEE